eukprot:230537-Lingulodinium_polyedra.AAC.1
MRLLRKTLLDVLAGNILTMSARRETLPEWGSKERQYLNAAIEKVASSLEVLHKKTREQRQDTVVPGAGATDARSVTSKE